MSNVVSSPAINVQESMAFCKHGPWHFIMKMLLQQSAVITSCVSITVARNQKNTISTRDLQWRATRALWWKGRLSVGAAANFIPERSFRALRRRFLPSYSLRFLFPSKHIFIGYVIKHDKIGSMEFRHSKPWLVILCRHKKGLRTKGSEPLKGYILQNDVDISWRYKIIGIGSKNFEV
jgi:hypothetical protein